ncbi:MAG: ergothioneine biosynthesis protein EgtB [Gammaproteobacteria bacterium]
MARQSSNEVAGAAQRNMFEHYRGVRNTSVAICQPLAIEDYTVQPCPEVSPPKWHLGHTTWFFEEMLLTRYVDSYQRFNPDFAELFNSYYKGAGKHWIQAERGQLSRPTVAEVLEYRQQVDTELLRFLQEEDPDTEILKLIELGLHHEQQHQELLYMDIKYILGVNPLLPCYATQPLPGSPEPSLDWVHINEGVYEVGHGNDKEFSYDNERPRHKTYLYPCAIRQSLVTNGEFLAFIEAGGYEKPEHWLSKGYDFIKQHNISAPLYWTRKNDDWYEFGLHGLRPLELNAPVCHISYFEASAFAAWSDARLPTEQEFEVALQQGSIPSEQKRPLALQPYNANAGNQLWCWTSSHYSPYPGFKTFDGPLHEYNGKFMCNQFVLRGGCVATPEGHLRYSYRNFYEPHQRWMFSGLRLARDEV